VTRVTAAATGALLMLVIVAAPVRAQGKGKGKQSSPPSSSPLVTPAASAPSSGAAAPLAWVEDASLVPQGAVAVSFSFMRWQGADASEVDVPIVGATLGLTPRVQLGASIPRVVGSELDGVVGGLGTTFISAKVALLDGAKTGVKLAVAPTLEILGEGALSGLAAGESRAQVGLPAMLEVEQGRARVFGSAGFFSRGVWFAGGGAGIQATPRVGISLAFSRAWSTDAGGVVAADRREVSGSVAVTVRPQIAAFGSVGRTVATSDQNGAGTTVSGGLVFVFAPASRK
jgi:hypothetical protein